jgi:hypothetical protein
MKKGLFEELKQSLREANLIKRGRLKPRRVFHVEPITDVVPAPSRLKRGRVGAIGSPARRIP